MSDYAQRYVVGPDETGASTATAQIAPNFLKKIVLCWGQRGKQLCAMQHWNISLLRTGLACTAMTMCPRESCSAHKCRQVAWREFRALETSYPVPGAI